MSRVSEIPTGLMGIHDTVHPWKLTGHWKIPMFSRKYISKWWIFHCHVSFRGGRGAKYTDPIDSAESRPQDNPQTILIRLQPNWPAFWCTQNCCLVQHQCVDVCCFQTQQNNKDVFKTPKVKISFSWDLKEDILHRSFFQREIKGEQKIETPSMTIFPWCVKIWCFFLP